MVSNILANAYVIGATNLQNWSQGYDKSGYLKVLPHPDQVVPFNDPYRDWQLGTSGNYFSSWGAPTELKATLTMSDLTEVKIAGFGILKAGDGKVPWLGDNATTPYEALRAYNGTIPGPVFITEPGDTLNFTLTNDLKNAADISNIHFHGLHVTPMGQGDNVLKSLSPGESTNVSVKIPDNHATGLDWYHPHLHGLTNAQVSSGLAGQLIVNPRHDLPDIAKFNPKTAPIHYLALNTFGIQQIDRVGKEGDPLNTNPTDVVPAGTPLQVSQNANGEQVYTLSDAPFVGYNGKTLGLLYDPANPTATNPTRVLFPYGGGPQEQPVENVIHTVNGQYNPTMQLTTGEWHTFGITNTSVNAFHVIQLIKDTGTELVLQDVSFVGFDGDASGVVPGKRIDVTELPLLGPGGRITLQEWFSEPGDYYLISNATNEILGDKAPTLTSTKGFSDGHLIWGSQVLASIKVTGPSTPVVAPFQPLDQQVEKAQKNDAFVAAVRAGDVVRERTYTWSSNLADDHEPGLDDAEPATFEGVYGINGFYFSENFIDSMPPLAISMLGTKEVWTVKNAGGIGAPGAALLEWHPFHIHQNEYSLIEINGISVADLQGQYKVDGFLKDTFNLPPSYIRGTATVTNPYGTSAPSYVLPDGAVVASEVKFAMQFEDFPGTFVNHCHILFHEDAGMMAPVRVILNTDSTWLGLESRENTNGQVFLVRANNLQQSFSLTPYGTDFKPGIDVAIGDVNFKKPVAGNKNVTDNITDVVTIQRSLEQPGEKFKVRIFDGATLIEQQQAGKSQLDNFDLTAVINEITPFQTIASSTEQIASVAVGDINGDGFSDIITGLGGGVTPVIEIYSGKNYQLLSRLDPFHHENFKGKINLAVGDINGDNYDDIIVGQGAGGKGLVEVYSGAIIERKGSLVGRTTAHDSVLLAQTFKPYGDTYTGEVKVTSGYVLQTPDAPNGAAVQTYHANITTIAGGMQDGNQQVKVWTYIGAGAHGHGSTTTATTEELRLDKSFTLDQTVEEVTGTFADIPNAQRGQGVLFARTGSGAYTSIHLETGNQSAFVNVASGTATLTPNSAQGILTVKTGGNGKPRIKITLTGYNSNQVHELGIFFVDDASGKVDGLLPGANGYAEAALRRGEAIFSALANNPNGFNPADLSRILELDFTQNLRFYLVKNSTTSAVRTGITSMTEVLFADPSTQQITDLGADGFSLAWKDGANNTVTDFQTLVAKIQPTSEREVLGTSLQGKLKGEVIDLQGLTGQVKADFTVHREAAFNNFVGFYKVNNADGELTDPLTGRILSPGDGTDYIKAAVSSRVAGIDLRVDNQGTATYTGTFEAGSIFAPFMIVNGSPEAILDGNPSNDPAVYFTYLGANTDKVDHVRLLGNNTFGFEDLSLGSSDRDFNDVIVKAELTRI